MDKVTPAWLQIAGLKKEQTSDFLRALHVQRK
jgi:hypothetical protein